MQKDLSNSKYEVKMDATHQASRKSRVARQSLFGVSGQKRDSTSSDNGMFGIAIGVGGVGGIGVGLGRGGFLNGSL